MTKMLPNLTALLWLAAAPLAGANAVRYELGSGSVLNDDCLNCDRPSIERPLSGSFILLVDELGGGGAAYQVAQIDLRDPAGDYRVAGAGKYSRAGGKTQEMILDLDVSGAGGVALGNGAAAIAASWPEVEIEVSESGERDPFHLFTLRIAARPRAAALAAFDVVKGSIFIDDCIICGRLTVPIPVAGTFLLGKVEDTPNWFTTYSIEALDIRAADPANPLRLTGGGCYQHGGHLAIQQHMNLEISVNETAGVLLSNPDAAPAGAIFPEIEIQLDHKNPESPLHVYSLHLVARPSETGMPLFRRGDANDDGAVDVSDSVAILFWRFAAGAAPGCLDAAETNGDALHDVSDAVFVLEYLFLDGPPPPEPGPEVCGPAKEPGAGCARYSSCLPGL